MNVRTGKAERIVAGVVVLLAAYVIRESLRMPLGRTDQPGPGFYPLVLGLLLCAAGLILLLQLLLQPLDRKAYTQIGGRDVFAIVLALMIAALLFERLGFIVTVGLFLFALLRVLSPLGWIKSGVAGVTTAIIASIFFQKILGVPLPTGFR